MAGIEHIREGDFLPPRHCFDGDVVILDQQRQLFGEVVGNHRRLGHADAIIARLAQSPERPQRGGARVVAAKGQPSLGVRERAVGARARVGGGAVREIGGQRLLEAANRCGVEPVELGDDIGSLRHPLSLMQGSDAGKTGALRSAFLGRGLAGRGFARGGGAGLAGGLGLGRAAAARALLARGIGAAGDRRRGADRNAGRDLWVVFRGIDRAAQSFLRPREHGRDSLLGLGEQRLCFLPRVVADAGSVRARPRARVAGAPGVCATARFVHVGHFNSPCETNCWHDNASVAPAFRMICRETYSCSSRCSAELTLNSPGASTLSSGTTPSSTIIEKRWLRSPSPNLLPSIVSPTARANSPLPSASIVTLSPASLALPQAPITKASLTLVTAISSTPFALISSALSRNPGKWRAEQVGVNAPGTATSATLRPAKNSSELTASGPFSVALTMVVEGSLSPTETVMSFS